MRFGEDPHDFAVLFRLREVRQVGFLLWYDRLMREVLQLWFTVRSVLPWDGDRVALLARLHESGEDVNLM